MIKVPEVGGLNMLGIIFGAIAKPTTFTLRLFTDVAALADGDINTTHTVAAGGGYADKTLSNNATVALASEIPEATWTEQSWIFTGALTGGVSVIGYQLLSGTTLLFEEWLLAPFTPANNGDELLITPRFKAGNGTPA